MHNFALIQPQFTLDVLGMVREGWWQHGQEQRDCTTELLDGVCVCVSVMSPVLGCAVS